MDVLIAYGSKRGGTAGLADMIASEFLVAGLPVAVEPTRQVQSVGDADAVVVAGALYASRWQRDARRFVKRFAEELRRRPVWLVSSGPLLRANVDPKNFDTAVKPQDDFYAFASAAGSRRIRFLPLTAAGAPSMKSTSTTRSPCTRSWKCGQGGAPQPDRTAGRDFYRAAWMKPPLKRPALRRCSLNWAGLRESRRSGREGRDGTLAPAQGRFRLFFGLGAGSKKQRGDDCRER